MNLPLIGTRYLSLSDEGVYLDSASVSRLRDRAMGKPSPKVRAIIDPKNPVRIDDDATETRVRLHERAMAAYRAVLARNKAKRERHNLLASEFEHIPFSWVKIEIIVKGRVTDTDLRIVAHMRRKNGDELRADIITGSLFDAYGICLSSSNLVATPAPGNPSKKQRTAYLESRKGGEQEDAE